MTCTVQYCAKVMQANWANFIFCSWELSCESSNDNLRLLEEVEVRN